MEFGGQRHEHGNESSSQEADRQDVLGTKDLSQPPTWKLRDYVTPVERGQDEALDELVPHEAAFLLRTK